MIDDIKTQKKKLEKSFVLPSKRTVYEYIFCMAAGFLFARISLGEIVDIFGYAWIITLFMWQKGVPLGIAGVLLGRLTLIGQGINIFTDIMMYIGQFMLLWSIKFVKKNVKASVYAAAGILFYAAIKTALLLMENFTLYKMLYIFLNLLAICIAIYVFYNLVSESAVKNFSSDAHNMILITFVTLAIFGIGKLNFLSIDIFMIAVSGVVFITAYSYGASAGALMGVLFGVLIGINRGFTVENIFPLAVCGVLCGALNGTNRAITGACIMTVYGAMFFLLEFGMGELHRFAETVMGVAILIFFPDDAVLRVRKIVRAVNAPVASGKTYADNIRFMCCDKIDEVADATHKMHSLLHKCLEDTQKCNTEQFERIKSVMTQTVCAHCTRENRCGFISDTAETLPECEVAEIVKKIQDIGNTWKGKMDLYEKIPEIITQFMHESVISIKKELYNAVKIDDALSEKLLCECKAYSKYVKDIAVVNTQNGKQVMVELKTVRIRESHIDELKGLCEDVIGIRLEEVASGRGSLCFVQKAKYTLSTGSSRISYDEDGICGDMCTVTHFGRSGYMLAVADGCGTGYKAFEESNVVIELLETMATWGGNEESSLSLVNAIMGLKSENDRYSTGDVCVFNKYTGKTKFIKHGAVSSFVIKGNGVYTVECGASPLGAQSEEKGMITDTLLSGGDVIVMMTDGVYEAFDGYDSPEEYFTELLAELPIKDSQELAEEIMNRAMAQAEKPKDDMLVFVAEVKKCA